MTLYRATVVSFSSSLYTASLRLDGSAAQTLDDVPVSAAIPPGAMVAARRCIVDFGESGELGELLVTAVDGAGGLFASGSGAQIDVADAAAAGSSTAAARDDHQHAFPAPAAGYPVDVATSEADGTATTVARADHQHKLGILTTKGDLLGFAAVPARQAVGSNYLWLRADSAQANGVGWAAPGDFLRGASQIDVVNTVVETAIFTGSVPAGALGTDRMVRLTLYGDYLNNSAAGKTVTFRVKYGATTLWGDISPSLTGNDPLRRTWQIELALGAQGASNVQVLSGRAAMTSTGVGSVAGIGTLAGTPTFDQLFYGSAAEDSTAAKTLAVTVQHSAAVSTVSIRRQYAALELL
jgi:hypothetical protein